MSVPAKTTDCCWIYYVYSTTECNTKEATSCKRYQNFEFNKTLWSGGKHSGFISRRFQVLMLKWKWLIFTYTVLDSCRHLCSKLCSDMTASVTLFCSLCTEHPTIHTYMWSVLLLLPLQSQVYEEIMRMFTTITVEAGNAAYSQSATDDRKSQYRWM
jgi:hypothetical protein